MNGFLFDDLGDAEPVAKTKTPPAPTRGRRATSSASDASPAARRDDYEQHETPAQGTPVKLDGKPADLWTIHSAGKPGKYNLTTGERELWGVDVSRCIQFATGEPVPYAVGQPDDEPPKAPKRPRKRRTRGQ